MEIEGREIYIESEGRERENGREGGRYRERGRVRGERVGGWER